MDGHADDPYWIELDRILKRTELPSSRAILMPIIRTDEPFGRH